MRYLILTLLVFCSACATKPALTVVHVSQTNGVTIGYEPSEYPGFVLVPKPLWTQIQKRMEEDLQR